MSERIWLQITSGRGPAECQLAVARLADVLAREAQAGGLACEVLDIVPGEAKGAALSTLLSLEGEGARRFALRTTGSVQWICPSPVRQGHKRKNWFVGVELLAPPEAASGALRAQDVIVEAMRASGPGGQHVNKTESAVRVTHKPTGLVATAREERSQAMNRKLALARLAGLLADGAKRAQAVSERERWATHDTLERGRPVRTFEGPHFKERR